MLWPYIVALLVPLAAVASDVKFVTEMHTSGYRGQSMVSTTTTFVSGRRIRREYRSGAGYLDGSYTYGPLIASVMLCDSGKAFEINTEDREYKAGEFVRYPSLEQAKANSAELKAKAATAAKTEQVIPTVVVERTTVRTGETREMFGHTARHVITTTRYVPEKGAQHSASEEVREGWYIDFDVRTDCMPDYMYPRRGTGVALLVGKLDAPLDHYKLHQVGEPETGFALQEKFTTRTAGLPDQVTEHVITQFSEQPLPDSLFAPPAGFKEVQRIRSSPPLPLRYRVAMWWERVRNWFR